MSDMTKPRFVFEGSELLENSLHAQLLARRRATFEHDLKNVMHGLLSGTELLGKALATNSARIPPADCLALLQQQLARAQGTLDRMLDEIAPADVASGDVALGELIEECARDLRHQLQRFELVSSVEPRLTVRGRRHRLKNALLCVLIDSMDHAPLRSTLSLTARGESGDTTQIELRHSVAPEARSADALTYIGEILHADAGRIEVTTSSNARHIVIRLPTAVPAQTQAGTPSLVIVDANRDAADSLAMLVQLEGFEAQAAYDVESAVQYARTRPTLAIVLDIDGSIDVSCAIARLRESSSPVRIIGVSHSPELRIANVDAQLRKPLDPGALRTVLDKG